MIKRLTVLFCVSLYAISAIGVPLHYHFCRGELQHVTLLARKTCDDTHRKTVSPFACCMDKNKPVCESKSEGDPCCDDQSQWLNADDDQLISNISQVTSDDVLAVECAIAVAGLAVSFTPDVQPNAHAPPPDSRRYLKHCSLVFYG